MKTSLNFINQLMESECKLDKNHMNAIRGGSNTGGSVHIDEDILIPDPPQ